MIFRFSSLHGISVPNKPVYIPKNQKELKEYLATVKLQEFFDFIQNTKVEKKLPTLIGQTEVRKARAKATAEVFTPNGLVNEMLDKLPAEAWQDTKTYLDDSCGNGQFLVWVLLRKIQAGQDPTEALKTIYGVELMPDNVKECRERLLSIIKLFTPAADNHKRILLTNIIQHDALTYDYEFNSNPTTEQIASF